MKSRRLVIATICIILLSAGLITLLTAGRRAADPVTAAWEKARAAGSYHFESEVTQITMPTAKVTNVGRSSRTERFQLNGANDLRAN
ncbi:MAG: hypothetical protein KDE54_37245, partial [Caldilineaceae bacterium]|nr:hypothetical protein [Caldilineaceae bacterium]